MRPRARILPLTLCLAACAAADDPRDTAAWRYGDFVYFADTALFTDCADGTRLPVATEGAYLALERAYLASGIEAGAALRIRVVARSSRRPAMEGGGDEAVLVVERFDPAGAGAPCPAGS